MNEKILDKLFRINYIAYQFEQFDDAITVKMTLQITVGRLQPLNWY